MRAGRPRSEGEGERWASVTVRETRGSGRLSTAAAKGTETAIGVVVAPPRSVPAGQAGGGLVQVAEGFRRHDGYGRCLIAEQGARAATA